MKAFVRRWLGLDGAGGLADVLAVKDAGTTALTARVDALEAFAKQAAAVLNDHTTSLQRFAVYEQQVPSIKRVFNAMRERAIRERKRKQAEAALAAPPVVDSVPIAQPADAVADDVSEQVTGG